MQQMPTEAGHGTIYTSPTSKNPAQRTLNVCIIKTWRRAAAGAMPQADEHFTPPT
jgi:hypothetical protein